MCEAPENRVLQFEAAVCCPTAVAHPWETKGVAAGQAVEDTSLGGPRAYLDYADMWTVTVPPPPPPVGNRHLATVPPGDRRAPGGGGGEDKGGGGGGVETVGTKCTLWFTLRMLVSHVLLQLECICEPASVFAYGTPLFSLSLRSFWHTWLPMGLVVPTALPGIRFSSSAPRVMSATTSPCGTIDRTALILASQRFRECILGSGLRQLAMAWTQKDKKEPPRCLCTPRPP